MGKKRSTASAGGSKGRSISKRDYKILKQVFIEYDKDSSGTVTYQEFLRALEGDDACSHGLKKSAAGMFDQMDGDQDGEVRCATQQVSRVLTCVCGSDGFQRAVVVVLSMCVLCTCYTAVINQHMPNLLTNLCFRLTHHSSAVASRRYTQSSPPL